MADDATPTILQLTPLNPDFQRDPHSVLGPLRDRCPVLRDETSGSFIISRFGDVRAIATDLGMWRDPMHAEEAAVMQRRFADAVVEGVPRSETTSILMLDNPDHARVRTPLAQALYARVARCRPDVERIVDEALDRVAGHETFDLMDAFCVPIPIDVIAAILGVDHDRLVEFRDWSEGVIQGLNPFRNDEQTAHMERASAALSAYFLQTIAERRANPRDDLISDMTRLQAEGAPLSDEELRINLGALLVGGNLTTTDLIGNGVRLLLLHPQELAKLRADPGLINGVVEEILRYEPPVDITGRIASHDMEVGGCPVKTSQAMTLSLRAANRDPEVFPDPDRFDISRKRQAHMAFGGGAHICIGAPLARLEAQVAIPRLFARFPNLRLAHPEQEAEWRTLPFFRGLARLELAV
ncbi:MAG TPA: cytochrome P450 [Phenylobacterium sp.]|nr:cytochrome P450 [Phenylobacterium sp.]